MNFSTRCPILEWNLTNHGTKQTFLFISSLFQVFGYIDRELNITIKLICKHWPFIFLYLVFYSEQFPVHPPFLACWNAYKLSWLQFRTSQVHVKSWAPDCWETCNSRWSSEEAQHANKIQLQPRNEQSCEEGNCPQAGYCFSWHGFAGYSHTFSLGQGKFPSNKLFQFAYVVF